MAVAYLVDFGVEHREDVDKSEKSNARQRGGWRGSGERQHHCQNNRHLLQQHTGVAVGERVQAIDQHAAAAKTLFLVLQHSRAAAVVIVVVVIVGAVVVEEVVRGKVVIEAVVFDEASGGNITHIQTADKINTQPQQIGSVLEVCGWPCLRRDGEISWLATTGESLRVWEERRGESSNAYLRREGGC